MEPPLSRRRLLGLAGVTAGGMAVAGAMGPSRLAGGTSSAAGSSSSDVVAFHGRRQAGVATAVQAHAVVVGVDVLGGRGELAALLDRWSSAAGRLAAGEQVGERSPSSRLPPVDSGEADDRPVGRLTITLAVGAALFGVGAPDRFGLVDRRPSVLDPLPAFAGDVLDPTTMASDLVVQICADDQQTALHAARNLVRVARGAVAVRWSHLGFGPPAGGPVAGSSSSHRNLLGFREGTANPRPGSAAFDDAVWVAPSDGPDWMVDGTYLVVRRVELDLGAWEDLNLLDRERVIGRHRRSGAPIGERDETASLDLDAEGPDGLPVTDPRSHVALAHRASAMRPLFRRSYNLAGTVPQFESAAPGDVAGLLFLAFCRDPRTQFVPLQHALAGHDLLGTYMRTTGSAVFAVLPGLAPGGSWSSVLFGTA